MALSSAPVKMLFASSWLRPDLMRCLGGRPEDQGLLCYDSARHAHWREPRFSLLRFVRHYATAPSGGACEGNGHSPNTVPTISSYRTQLADTRCEALGVGKVFCLASWNGTRCGRIFSITSGWSMKMRIAPSQRGHASGSAS